MSREAERVCRSVEDVGPRPEWHAEQVDRLAEEWPTLARALRELMRTRGYRPPQRWEGLG